MRISIQIVEFFGLRTHIGLWCLSPKNKRSKLYFKIGHQCWLKGMRRKEETLNSKGMTDYRKGRERTFFFFFFLPAANCFLAVSSNNTYPWPCQLLTFTFLFLKENISNRHYLALNLGYFNKKWELNSAAAASVSAIENHQLQ